MTVSADGRLSGWRKVMAIDRPSMNDPHLAFTLLQLVFLVLPLTRMLRHLIVTLHTHLTFPPSLSIFLPQNVLAVLLPLPLLVPIHATPHRRNRPPVDPSTTWATPHP